MHQNSLKFFTDTSWAFYDEEIDSCKLSGLIFKNDNDYTMTVFYGGQMWHTKKPVKSLDDILDCIWRAKIRSIDLVCQSLID